jgi:hypothetical protein
MIYEYHGELIMGCPNAVRLNENLTFSITTHDPDTGVLTDADAAPTYRIYEEDTEIAILSGSMDLFDGLNTTGFYLKKIAITTANRFATRKSYTIYITAIVQGDIGGISYAFRVANDIQANEIAGAGTTAWSYVVTSSITGLPLANVDVWVTSDIDGNNIIASGKTNLNGFVTFYLDLGMTIYVWCNKSGFNFTNPDTEVV